MSCIIVFITNSESVISWYNMPQFSEAVKELYELLFVILINRITLNLLFVGYQVRKKHISMSINYQS